MNKTEYLLICLMEECAEIQQIASKCLRFGLGNHHPDGMKCNDAELQRELTDLDAIRFLLIQEKALKNRPVLYNDMVPKMQKVEHFMGVSRDCGTLEAESEADR